ncbi:hypothetical protein Pfo_022840 [Paulownia fortunei]|nr:hypothetical protein Pfo_022840 [Paulownia fortunei]
MEEEEEEQVRVLKEEKLKLEEKYCVRISERAFDLAVVHCLGSSGPNLILEDATPEKVVEILDGACELVLEKFRNCAHESEFCEKAYELRRALVEIIELYRDNHPHSQSWLTRVKLERDSASIDMNDCIQKWEHVLMSSGGCGILTPECAKMLGVFKAYASTIAYLDCPLLNKSSWWELTSIRSDVDVAREVGRFLDDIQGQLIECFQFLLTVKACHVAEVVSRLTDVPLTQILTSSRYLKEMAIYRTKQRVVNQEHVIDEIFKIVVCQRHMSTRPRGSFLLLGPTGVGKREIAKAIAEHWYCDVSRLVEMDMSEYAEPQLESASYLSEWSKRKRQDLWNRLTKAVGKRPYSVIHLDKIDKASSCVTGILLEVLSNDALTDIEGNPVDFSKAIIFMTSSVGATQLELACTCFDRNAYAWNHFRRNPQEFYKTHNCDLKGSGCERVVVEARKFFSADLLDSLDKVFVVEKFRNQKAVARLLLREIVRKVAGGRLIVHASDAALDVLLGKASTESVGAGMAIKKSLLEHVVPQLSAAEGYNSAVVCVDTLVGTYELSFRFHTEEQSLDDWYFKQKDGTFGKLIANLRMKVESVYRILNLRKECLPLLDRSGQNLSLLGKLLLAICDSILLFSPFPNPPPEYVLEEGASCNVAPNNLPTVEEKEKIKNLCRSLRNDTGLAKATRVIINAVVKIIDAPLQLPDLPGRQYLFLGLDDDAKMGLINGLTESLRTDSGKSLFTYVKLDNNCRGEEVKKLVIEEVKERPCMVLLFEGVEFADAVLYRSLLEIFDKGTLDDGEGFVVDFRKTIVILTSDVANTHKMAKRFKYPELYVLHNVAMNQIVKRFRTELLHRIDKIILFDPVSSEHGGIIHIHQRGSRYMKLPDNVLLSRFHFNIFEA